MKTSAQYLEAEKLEELARRYEAEGYEVALNADRPEPYFDLTARRAGRTVAVEVKAGSRLAQSAEEIEALRQRAREEGFDEFRLVVANPPRATTVDIPGLQDKLLTWMTETTPGELDELSTRTQPQYVSDLDIHSVEVQPGELHVTGSGTVEVMLEYDGGEERDGLDSSMDFPFEFRVVLDRDLEIQEVEKLRIDTSAFYE
jgi:Holliday junction resolvase-like predicted endonuclease